MLQPNLLVDYFTYKSQHYYFALYNRKILSVRRNILILKIMIELDE